MYKTDEILSIEDRIDKYIDTLAPEIKDKIKNKRIINFPELEVEDFDDLLDLQNNQQVNISPINLNFDYDILKLVGYKSDISKHLRLMFLYPIIALLIIVFSAILSNNYWVLLSLFFYPFCLFFSIPAHNIIGYILSLLYIGSMISALVMLILGNYILFALLLSYAILHSSIYNYRSYYDRAILKSALISEKVFIFLLYFDRLRFVKLQDGRFIRLQINKESLINK
jgi:hypothetical protein